MGLPEKLPLLPKPPIYQVVEFFRISGILNLMTKKITLLIGFLIIASILHLSTQLLPTLSETPTSTNPIPTVPPSINAKTPGWEVFTSKDYGFRIEYPKDYSVDELKREDGTYSLMITSNPDGEIISVIVGGEGISRSDYYYGGFEWTKSVIEALARVEPGETVTHKYETITKTENVSLKDFTGAKYATSMLEGSATEGSERINLAVIKDNRTFMVTAPKSDDKTFQKMIDSFEL